MSLASAENAKFSQVTDPHRPCLKFLLSPWLIIPLFLPHSALWLLFQFILTTHSFFNSTFHLLALMEIMDYSPESPLQVRDCWIFKVPILVKNVSWKSMTSYYATLVTATLPKWMLWYLVPVLHFNPCFNTQALPMTIACTTSPYGLKHNLKF